MGVGALVVPQAPSQVDVPQAPSQEDAPGSQQADRGYTRRRAEAGVAARGLGGPVRVLRALLPRGGCDLDAGRRGSWWGDARSWVAARVLERMADIGFRLWSKRVVLAVSAVYILRGLWLATGL